jgi:hypothetical protein
VCLTRSPWTLRNSWPLDEHLSLDIAPPFDVGGHPSRVLLARTGKKPSGDAVISAEQMPREAESAILGWSRSHRGLAGWQGEEGRRDRK